jgi:hypothetical protein
MAALRIRILNVYGNPLSDRGDVQLYEHSTGDLVGERRDRMLTPTLKVDSKPNQLYKIRVFPTHYRPVGRFIRTRAGGKTGVEITCPIHPGRVTSVEFPTWQQLRPELRRVLQDSSLESSNQQGEALYLGLGDLQKSGLLNLFAKMTVTLLPGANDAWGHVKGLYRVRGDRIFADVQPEFRDAVKNAVAADEFEEVDGSLHTPPPGFQHAGSYKTFDAYGNLQLTFFASVEAPLRFKVDADIDDARGIEHFFDVIHHFISDTETHPYDIHEILVAKQQIDPGYVLKG